MSINRIEACSINRPFNCRCLITQFSTGGASVPSLAYLPAAVPQHRLHRQAPHLRLTLRSTTMPYNPTPGQIYSPSPPLAQQSYSSTPPAPPPKPSGSSTPSRGPPLPPPPPGSQHQVEPSELDGSQSYPPQQQQPPQNLPQIPPIDPNWLPETLRDKTTTDLNALLQDPSLQAALLADPSTTHPALPASQSALKPLIDSNLALASSLSDLESHLSTLRASTQSRLLALKALEQQHRSKLAETEKALASFSPQALYQRLAAGVQEQEQLVKGLEESWMDEEGVASEREVGEFVRRVKEAKALTVLRRERKYRWDEGRVGGWR